MYSCFLQPSHSPNTISSHLNLIFSFSKNLKQCFLWKITHKCKSYFYPLGLKQVLSFHFYRDYLKISLCWEWKYNVFVSSRKKYRGPEIDRCLDQRKKTCYIISRTIYLQICILWTEINIMQSMLQSKSSQSHTQWKRDPREVKKCEASNSYLLARKTETDPYEQSTFLIQCCCLLK